MSWRWAVTVTSFSWMLSNTLSSESFTQSSSPLSAAATSRVSFRGIDIPIWL